MQNPSNELLNDSYAVDASYRPFPPFSEWLGFNVDAVRWQRYTTGLEQRRQTASKDVLEKAQNIVRRAAAVDTGALEGLYEVDRGFTFTVATEAAFWQARVDEKGEQVRGYIEAQLEAYEYILNLATGETPVSEAAIRSLHEIICRSQETYTAVTEIGPQAIRLRKGQYKTSPNHVRDRDGNVHAYAPVGVTPSEMHRLCQELRSETFVRAHPALQAAYAHYSFVLVHPFADGNGRVARALASAFTYRAQYVPLLILAEKRDDYLDALSEADKGRPQSFVDFISERVLDSIQLVEESIRAALPVASEQSLQRLQRLNQTQSGYTHVEIDKAASSLLGEMSARLSKKLKAAAAESGNVLTADASKTSGWFSFVYDHYRGIGNGENAIRVSASTKTLPQNASINRNYGVSVPVDSGLNDDIVIQTADYPPGQSNAKNVAVFETRVSELLPQLSAVTQMRLDIFVQRIVDEALAELEQKAREGLGQADD